MNNGKLTVDKTLAFFKALKGDEITFETEHCGTYTDLYSEIYDVEPTSLRVKVNSGYINPDCVDSNNFTNVSIESIRNIIGKYTSITESEIDGKIISLEAFLSRNSGLFNPSDQKILEKLLLRFRTFYSEVLHEKSMNFANEKVGRTRFDALFIDLAA